MNVIIDYNVGNLHNLKNALDYGGIESKLVSHADDVKKAGRILLPGVGAFAPAMDHLKNSGMLEALQEKFQSGAPMLGVCVGAQLITKIVRHAMAKVENKRCIIFSNSKKRYAETLVMKAVGLCQQLHCIARNNN